MTALAPANESNYSASSSMITAPESPRGRFLLFTTENSQQSLMHFNPGLLLHDCPTCFVFLCIPIPINLKESSFLVTCTPPPSENKATHCGFETQRKRQQKSKIGVSVANKKDLFPPKKFLKRFLVIRKVSKFGILVQLLMEINCN